LRTLTLSVVAFLALLLVPAALAAQPRHVTLVVSNHRILYGHPLVLSGRLTGPDRAGRTVRVLARTYGSSAPHRIGVAITGPTGRWTLSAMPRILTVYEAAARGVTSPKVAVGVAPAIAVRELANGRLRVEVHAARPFTDRLVEIQKPVAARRWATVARKRLSHASIAVVAPPRRATILRAAMSVNEAGAGYLGAASHAFTYRPVVLTLEPQAYKVQYGHSLHLSGHLIGGRAGEVVALYEQRYGHAPSRVTRVLIGKDGRFTMLVTPTIQTTYEARVGHELASRPVTVGVKPAMTIDELANGRLATRVVAGVSFRGKFVELQRRQARGAWKTVAKIPLGSRSTAVFKLTPPHSTIRVAMSVNQAGAGYLGASSHPLLYRAV
jgi:hypothetical protein